MAHYQVPLFDDCFISFIQSTDLTQDNVRQLTEVIEPQGGHIIEPKADGRIKLSEVTHIISETSDFPDYHKAVEHCIPVVKKAWITTTLVKNKLAPVRPFTPDPKLFFSNVVVFCADIPEDDKDAIVGAVTALGGLEAKALSKQMTHVVALSTDHPAYKAVKQKRLPVRIVLPHWFDDCLKLGRRIDEKPYLLPNPDILKNGPADPLPVPSTPNMVGATSARPDYLPKPATPDIQKLHVFDNKKIMLSDDLQLTDRLHETLEGLIQKGGGSIVTDVQECDMFVCQYRDGDNYIMASRQEKTVGNLSWLFYLITYNTWTSPLRRLLHYPVPRDGIPGFKESKMSISNYGGEARIYLENLIKACGGECTKSMRLDNTHLITARATSEKCDAAQEWGVPMVNHLWVEESYAKCKAQSLTNPRYSYFPPRTNLGEVIGQTQLDPEILETVYYSSLPDSQRSRSCSTQSPVRGRSAMQDKDSSTAKPAAALPEDDTETEGEAEAPSGDETDMPDAPPVLPPPQTVKSKRPSTTPAPERTKKLLTPASRRVREASKENEAPRSTPSRGAKDRAMSVLHDLADDIALYEKEKARTVVGGVWGGKRAADKADKEREREQSTKRGSSVLEAEAEDENDGEARASKKAKLAVKQEAKPKPKMQMKLLITGYRKWQNELGSEDRDKKKLKELGIQVVSDASACNYLAAPAMVRTQKFLCALANGVTILNSEFIDTCITSSTLPDPTKFILVDKNAEKRFKVVLSEAVARAKVNKKNLLAGVAVYCTENIPNGGDTYKSIVAANGGEFATFKGRAGSLRPRQDSDIKEVYLLTGLSAKEKPMWAKFTQMGKAAGHKPRVVLTDWLLDTCMAQEIKWKDEYLAK